MSRRVRRSQIRDHRGTRSTMCPTFTSGSGSAPTTTTSTLSRCFRRGVPPTPRRHPRRRPHQHHSTCLRTHPSPPAPRRRLLLRRLRSRRRCLSLRASLLPRRRPRMRPGSPLSPTLAWRLGHDRFLVRLEVRTSPRTPTGGRARGRTAPARAARAPRRPRVHEACRHTTCLRGRREARRACSRGLCRSPVARPSAPSDSRAKLAPEPPRALQERHARGRARCFTTTTGLVSGTARSARAGCCSSAASRS